jgi:molecular chaperone HscB
MPNHFEVLGLPRRFALAGADIEANYLARSRETHPDFHQLAATSEQRASLELTALLNEAYNTLRDPFKRADYLLTLEGGPSAAEAREMSPHFLEEMLELRMEIEELRERSEPAALAVLERQLQERRGQLIAEIGARFAEYEQTPPSEAKRRAILVGVRQLLNTARYIQGQLRDLRADREEST